MKPKKIFERLQMRQIAYEAMRQRGLRDEGPSKRLRSGGYRRPGALNASN